MNSALVNNLGQTYKIAIAQIQAMRSAVTLSKSQEEKHSKLFEIIALLTELEDDENFKRRINQLEYSIASEIALHFLPFNSRFAEKILFNTKHQRKLENLREINFTATALGSIGHYMSLEVVFYLCALKIVQENQIFHFDVPLNYGFHNITLLRLIKTRLNDKLTLNPVGVEKINDRPSYFIASPTDSDYVNIGCFQTNLQLNADINFLKILGEGMDLLSTLYELPKALFKDTLNKLNLNDRPIAVFHHRQSSSRNENPNLSTSRHRNSELQSYALALQFLNDKGFSIVRIGDKTLPRIPNSLSFIVDLSEIEDSERALETFILQRSTLYIGSSSGPTTAIGLFNCRRLIVNSIGVDSIQVGLTLNDRMLPKRLLRTCKDDLHQEDVDIASYLDKTFIGFHSILDFEYRSLTLKDNTEGEILTAAKELYSALSENLKETNLSIYQQGALQLCKAAFGPEVRAIFSNCFFDRFDSSKLSPLISATETLTSNSNYHHFIINPTTINPSRDAHFILDQYNLNLSDRIINSSDIIDKSTSDVNIFDLQSNPNQIEKTRSTVNNREALFAKRRNPNPNSGQWITSVRDSGHSVAEELFVARHNPIISRETRLVSMGSCFAVEIAHWLQRNSYNYIVSEPNLGDRGTHNSSAKWGTIFNTPGFEQVVAWAFGTKTPPMTVYPLGNSFRDPFREDVTYNMDAVKNLSEIWETHLHRSRIAISRANVIIVTAGLNEVFRYLPTGDYLHRTPWGMNPLFWEPVFLSVEDNVNFLLTAIDTVREFNPNVMFIFSVSPVPLVRTFQGDLHVAEATALSKSVLRIAMHQVCSKRDDIYYMPSYETVMYPGSLEAWEDDFRHVSPNIVEKVMRTFEKMFVIP